VSVDQVNDDAFAALAHLRSRPDVIGERIAVMGYSYGAMAALRLASASYHGRDRRFGAVVSVYPVCVSPRAGVPAAAHERLTNLRDDVDIPTLVLIGDADQEVANAGLSCDTAVRRLQAAGKPISIKLYPGVQHGFDQPGPRYSQAATVDAKAVSVEFLNRQLPSRPR
jgi:dienelactone hydrolase